MKKRKFNILLNIAVLCMCVCAIAIGVYSAKSASLTASGTVGFIAHNCHIKITPSVTGYDSNGNKQTNKEQTAVEIGKTSSDSTGSLTLENLNFNDLNNDGNVIVITLNIENLSAFDVQATISAPTIKQGTTEIPEAQITKVVQNGSTTLSSNSKVKIGESASISLIITLTVVNFSEISEETLNNSAFSINIKFEKYVEEVPEAYIASNWKRLIFTNFGNENGFCTNNDISKLTFTNVKPSNYTGVTIKVGADALDIERTLNSELTNKEVEDVIAYGIQDSSTSKYEILLYSPGKIYIGNKGYNADYSLISNGYQFSELMMSTIEWGNADFTKTTTMECMFIYCRGLTNLDVSNFNTSSVTTMGNMFSGCSRLTDLDVSNFNTSKVTNMPGMFSDCSGLTNLDVSNFNTSKVTNMYGMFSGCSGLTSIYVNSTKWKTSQVTSSGSMFFGCSNLPNYKADVVDKTNAHTGEGGYLTEKA